MSSAARRMVLKYRIGIISFLVALLRQGRYRTNLGAARSTPCRVPGAHLVGVCGLWLQTAVSEGSDIGADLPDADILPRPTPAPDDEMCLVVAVVLPAQLHLRRGQRRRHEVGG